MENMFIYLIVFRLIHSHFECIFVFIKKNFCSSIRFFLGSTRTSFLAGSSINVTWHLAYPHRVSFFYWNSFLFNILYRLLNFSIEMIEKTDKIQRNYLNWNGRILNLIFFSHTCEFFFIFFLYKYHQFYA